jgi:hypothetical protein
MRSSIGWALNGRPLRPVYDRRKTMSSRGRNG